MEAKELRIGNWILNGINEEFQVNGITITNFELGQSMFGEFKPIPLTEEWLLKLGFENKHTNIFTKQIIISECTAQEKLKLEGWAGNIFLIIENQFASNGCKHVHELQNLYFAIKGEELTI